MFIFSKVAVAGAAGVDVVRVGGRGELLDGKLSWQQQQNVNASNLNVDGKRKKNPPPLHLTYHITEMHIMSFFQVLLELWITVFVRHGEMFT